MLVLSNCIINESDISIIKFGKYIEECKSFESATIVFKDDVSIKTKKTEDAAILTSYYKHKRKEQNKKWRE